MTDQPQGQLPDASSSVANVSGGEIEIGGDVVGRDKIVQQVSHQAPAPIVQALHQLRAPLEDFKGRKREIEQLKQELHKGHSVIICGLGGTGKTELAVLVANELCTDYSDAQLFVELRGSDITPRNPAEALTACIRAFVGQEAKLPSPIEELALVYRSNLSGKRVLIVLDDAADNAQVQHFLPPAGCVLVITSRQKLTLQAMARITLNEFAPDEAHQLLVSLAPRTARPLPVPLTGIPEAEARDLRKRRTTPELADQICYLCGDLPLALHAAGSLLNVNEALDPAGYVTKLRDERTRLEHIGMEGVDLSVEACFSSSYMHLLGETARVFRYLAVFPGTFDASIEEVVCQDESHSQLATLVRHSVVAYSQTTDRYRLHDLVRVFIAKRLSVTEQETAAKNIIESLKDATHRYERSIYFGECLLEPQWSLTSIRAAVLEVSCELMLDVQLAQADHRKVALLLTRLRWLDDTWVSPDEMLVYQDLIGRYVASIDDRRYLVRHITAMLDSKKVKLYGRQEARLLVRRAAQLGPLGNLDAAEADYKRADELVAEFIQLAAQIKMGAGVIALSRAEELADREDEPQRVQLLNRAAGLCRAAAKMAEVYNEDVALSAGIYQELNGIYVLLSDWEKAEEYYHEAFQVLEHLKDQDPKAYAWHYMELLEAASDTHLQKGQSLVLNQDSLSAVVEYETAYRYAGEAICLLKRHLGDAGRENLVYAYMNAGESLWRMSECQAVASDGRAQRRAFIGKSFLSWHNNWASHI